MSAIITFFESIINFIETMVQSAVWLVTMLPSYGAAIASSITFMPPFIAGFLSVSLSLTLVFAVIRLL